MKKSSDERPPIPNKPRSLSCHVIPGQSPSGSSSKPPPVPKKPRALSYQNDSGRSLDGLPEKPTLATKPSPPSHYVTSGESPTGSSHIPPAKSTEPTALSRPVAFASGSTGSPNKPPPVPIKPRRLSNRIVEKIPPPNGPPPVPSKPGSLSRPVAESPKNPAPSSNKPPVRSPKPSWLSSRVVSNESPGSLSPGLRTFALVIGIDDYISENKPKLQAAENDAREMHKLLRVVYGVPQSHIRVLYNQAATRKRIIEEFQAFVTNEDIQKNDAIIIYFAGHGSRALAPSNWKVEDPERMVETLCPVDEESKEGSLEIHGIPDLTISTLVNDIKAAKGDNIVLIFDCCHSGGMARGDDSKNERSRSAKTIAPLPIDLDKDILQRRHQTRGGGRRAGFSTSLSNYVLLAACRAGEEALETVIEDKPRGVFSSFLFRHLSLSGAAMTYSDLLGKVLRDMEGANHRQHPICEGERKGCPLFDGIATRRDGKLFTVTMEEQGTLKVNAGAIHGVNVGCRFGLRQLDPKSGAFLEVGLLEVETVSIASSVLKPVAGVEPPTIIKECPALVEVWGHSEHLLDIHFDGLPSTWVEPSLSCQRYRTTSVRSQRTLVLREAAGSRISFERGSPIVEHIDERLVPLISFTPPTLQRALNFISDFHFHLGRGNPFAPVTLHDTVKLGIHNLQDGIAAPNLFSTDGRVEVTTGDGLFFTIVNDSPHHLFPYLFFFDPTEYSIQDWYFPPQENALAPLPSGSPNPLRIGFGDTPFEFTVPDGATRDIGFVKLFVSTCEIDMESLIQDSPFAVVGPSSNESAPSAGGGGSARGGRVRTKPRADIWAEYCYTVIIRRGA